MSENQFRDLVDRAIDVLGMADVPDESDVLEAVQILSDIGDPEECGFDEEFCEIYAAIIEPFVLLHMEEDNGPLPEIPGGEIDGNPYRKQEPRTPFNSMDIEWRKHLAKLIRQLNGGK